MLDDEYFAALPPKTTGRERFGAQFLEEHARSAAASFARGRCGDARRTDRRIRRASDSALQASPARASSSAAAARTIAHCSRGSPHGLGRQRVETSDVVGIPVDAKEAIAFACSAMKRCAVVPPTYPPRPVLSAAVVLGAIAPHNLLELLAQVERECRESE